MRKIIDLVLRLATAGAFVAFTGLGSVTSASAAPSIPDALQHIIDCAGWMFTDPARHAAECGPGHDYTGQFSNAWGLGTGAPPVVTTCPTIPQGVVYPGRASEPSLLLVQSSPCDCPTPNSFTGTPSEAGEFLSVDSCCLAAYKGSALDRMAGVLPVTCRKVEDGAYSLGELVSPDTLI